MTASTETYTDHLGFSLSDAEAQVMHYLTTTTNPAPRVKDIVAAGSASESAVRSALESLRSANLVKQSSNRGSHGYAYWAVSDQDRAASERRRAMVEALTEALQSMTGSVRGIDVAGRLSGGVSIDLDLNTADVLLVAIQRYNED